MAYEDDQRLGDLFQSQRGKGISGLPKLSVTMNDGLVDRDSLDRKMETNLADEDHLLVRKGDIAYNMMRMWQGASGLAEKDGLVSPAYVVLAPKPKIDSRYASYLFKSQRMIHLFWAYSYGLTSDRLRLYYPDFARIPVAVPSIKEQVEIAKILSVWEKAIEVATKLVANNKEKKKALMQNFFQRKQRLLGFSGRVKSVEFGSFAALVKDRCEPTLANRKWPCIELEHIESKTGRILGATTSDCQTSLKAIFASGDVLFGKLRPYLQKCWFADSAGYCSTEIWVLSANQKLCLPQYLHLICQTDRFLSACLVMSGSKMPRAEWSIVSKTPFLLPSLKEQQAVVEIVSTASKGIDTELQDLDALAKQKQALMQQLLTGKRRVKLLARHEHADA